MFRQHFAAVRGFRVCATASWQMPLLRSDVSADSSEAEHESGDTRTSEGISQSSARKTKIPFLFFLPLLHITSTRLFRPVVPKHKEKPHQITFPVLRQRFSPVPPPDLLFHQLLAFPLPPLDFPRRTRPKQINMQSTESLILKYVPKE